MTPIPEAHKPNRKMLVLSGTVVIAVAINLGLLLLISTLISHQETELAQLPKLQPVNFIRIQPRRETPPSPPPEEKTIVDETNNKPSTPPAKSSASSKPAPARKSRPRQVKQSAKAQAEQPGFAAPRLDIPAQGDGVAFPNVQGSDDRLTAPPAQWNPQKQPPTGNAGEGDAGGEPSKSKLVALSRVLPDYPPRARAQGIQGWVKLEITVTPAGRVSAAKVIDASPKGLFDEAAMEAIQHWRFQPAYRDGQAIEQRAHQIIKFRLTEQ
ncbi:MAG: energy transducer TonB [Methylomonas sp.]|nr:energy transducer TonB [Methylomonas sp.]